MERSENVPAFWMTGEITGGELRVSESPGGLLASLVEGYRALPETPTREVAPREMFLAWNEVRLHDRYAYACQVATEYQARALVAASKLGEWSLEGESDDNIDRLYTTRSYIPDNRPWPPHNVRLIIVHPVLESIQWDPPVTSRSLVIIDPRTEVNLLRGLEACGALSSAGRLDLRSRYKHPLGL